MSAPHPDGRARVLVKEKIGDPGVDLLRAHFDVDLGLDWSDEELGERIGDYDGILIRSATTVDAALIGRARSLKVIGRAGVGVDNVDVGAATKQGIVVANAPQSNVVTAAEHTMALLLALARNVPQAHASLVAGRWERSRFSGVELMDKTLGVLGFGRIGQLVAQRAMGFGMRVIAFDPFVSAERYRELGVEKADSPDDVYARADFLTLHLPKNDQTEGWLDAEALAKCKEGVRVLNVARGPLIVDEDLEAALDSGKVGGAALDVFRTEPITEHPLFGRPNVIVTPHLGASTAEAEENCAVMVVDQLRDFLEHGNVTNAVNFPQVGMARESAWRIGIANANVPNMLGQISTAMADAGLNIHNMVNKSRGDMAYTLVDVDSAVADGVLDALRGIAGVLSVRYLPDAGA